jgi:hypothetical protein
MIKTTRPVISNLNRLAEALKHPENKTALNKAVSRAKNLEIRAASRISELSGCDPILAKKCTEDVYINTARLMSMVEEPKRRNKIATDMANDYRKLMSN